MSGTHRLAAIACSLAMLTLGSAAAAQDLRVERLRWTDTENPAGTAMHYRVHFGTSSRSYSSSRLIPVPTKVDGVYQADIPLEAPKDVNLYIALTTLNADGLESFYSNEICRAPGGGPCGGSGGSGGSTPPPTSTAKGAINGFALWNAQTDTVVDGNFTSGETISLAKGTCFAIEILTNSYLSNSGPGSVRKIFDGQHEDCTEVGVTHENSAPYAWEADAGPGQFECSPTLTIPGQHTLEVTPFDGDDCTGAAGTMKSLTFTVEPAAGGSGGTTVGQPGQPFLIQ